MENFSEDFKREWERFKDKVANKDLSIEIKDIFNRTIFFVHFYEGNLPNSECIVGQKQLDTFLEEEFWKNELYRDTELRKSMDNYNVWKLVSESDVKQFPSLFADVYKTDLTIKGEIQYIKLVEITVQKTVSITTE